MQSFKHYLDATGEIGFVEQSLHTLVYVAGLPQAKPSEVVLFEGGEVGQVFSLTEDYAEILLLSKTQVPVGSKVVRTGDSLKVSVSASLLGKTLDSLGAPVGRAITHKDGLEHRPLEVIPPGIQFRKNIQKPFETGVTWVDLVVPMGRGQRQLVIGDRKTGKTPFLLQSVYSAALRGTVTVYAAIAKRALDIKAIEEFFKKAKIVDNTVIVATSSADPAGLVFLTPYTAMTIAEYFRDLGREVLVIFDDLTAHAKYYREITLLARRFPGRSSYPGDIFYTHSRLLERAGNFQVKVTEKGKKVNKEVAITALPVAELILGDLSGYIQTNLMAMTDGHIYFDIDRYNQGRRPPINPFLSVTRVGRQAQTPLLRDISSKLTSFLVRLEDLKQFMQFGAELTEKTKRDLVLGERLTAFFDQPQNLAIPLSVNVVVLSALWANFWSESDIPTLKSDIEKIITAYSKDKRYQAKIDNLVRNIQTFKELIDFVKQNESVTLGLGK
ncbi:hypothetical protein IID22_00960 [Patescibacteria group bacterium]|nr:hypothetical protein [Patescibacteria group bacterium]